MVEQHGRLPLSIQSDRRLNPLAKLVWLNLEMRQGQNSHAHPGHRRIAADLGTHPRQVRRSIEQLIAHGHLEVDRGTGRSTNHYRLTYWGHGDPTHATTSGDTVTPERGHCDLSSGDTVTPKQTNEQTNEQTNLDDAASTARPARQKRKPKPGPKKSPPDPRVAELRLWWLGAYERHRGVPYIDTSPARDSAVIKTVLRALDRDRNDGVGTPSIEVVKAAATRLLTDPPAWMRGQPSITALSATINELTRPSEAQLGQEAFERLQRMKGDDPF
jgi:hypothetical protein